MVGLWMCMMLVILLGRTSFSEWSNYPWLLVVIVKIIYVRRGVQSTSECCWHLSFKMLRCEEHL